jgi:hypothetical protein
MTRRLFNVCLKVNQLKLFLFQTYTQENSQRKKGKRAAYVKQALPVCRVCLKNMWAELVKFQQLTRFEQIAGAGVHCLMMAISEEP